MSSVRIAPAELIKEKGIEKMIIRDIIVKVHYVADDELIKSGVIKMTSPTDVEKYLKPDLEEIFDAEGYRGMEIRVEDTEIV